MPTRREFLRRSLVYALGSLAVAACSPSEVVKTILPTLTPSGLSTIEPTSTPIPSATSLPPTNTVPIATRVPPSPTPFQAYLSVARGTDARAITRAAVDALGGIGRFVHRGDEVIVKPNICSASYGAEYASTTNPEVIAELITLCFEAGASRVRVMDLPFSGTAAEAYKVSGIQAAVEKARGQMEIMSQAKYADMNFPNARNIKTWKVYQGVLKANVLINVPIAKTHSVSGLTLGMKNLMGVILKRAELHWALDQRIADLATLIKPTLNVIDGTRVLTRNGPVSGNLQDVFEAHTVIATHDIVAADAYAAQVFFTRKPESVNYVRIAQEMKLGRYDFQNLNIKEL